MTQDRSGSYPPPLYWPAKLASDGFPTAPHPMSFLCEGDAVQHDFVADGWPGPCSISFRDGSFLTWQPATTAERAAEYARKA